MHRILLTALLLAASSLAFAERPHILVILVDDLGYGDLESYGATDLRTPHIDALMARGTRLDQFYANCTVCTPTRASLLTGRYPDMAGAPGVIRQWDKDSWGYLDPGAPTLPDLLKQGGYRTAMVGKWHLGFESPNIPNDRGFDFFHGFLGDMMDDYWKHLRGGENWMRRDREVIEPEGHATELFTKWSCDYIREHVESGKRERFFLYLAYNAPHFPIQPPREWLDKVVEREPQLDRKRAANVAFIEHLDDGIGTVLATLRDQGIADETLVVFSSDNGGSIPHAQSNGDLRGGKQDHWEGGIRVPTCVVWPGQIPVRRSNELGMTMDLLPTLCDIAGVEIDHDIDGRSLAPVWLDGKQGDPERQLVWVRREGNPRYQGRAYYAIRRGKWKLLQNHPFEPMRLFDLEADPGEQTPVKNPKVERELWTALMKHIQRAGHVPWQNPRPE